MAFSNSAGGADLFLPRAQKEVWSSAEVYTLYLQYILVDALRLALGLFVMLGMSIVPFLFSFTEL